VLGIFLDTETNGLNPHKHKVIELAYKILDVGSGEEKVQFQSVIFQPWEEWQKSDPESLQVNGFTWEEISLGKNSQAISHEIIETFSRIGIKRGEAVFICQNPSFDRIFFSQLIDPDIQERLRWPYHWLDLASMYWAESIRKGKESDALFPWNTGFSKDRIAAAYGLASENKPHRAMNGVTHLLLCYQKVVGFPCK
jgi:oligoribonuclease (3'-5' exoribonuclease)